MFKKRKVKLVTIGYGGNGMEYGGGCRGSWYIQEPAEIVNHYSEELAEGVLLLDKRPAI